MLGPLREQDRAEKAAKAAQQRLQTQERRRSGKGRIDIVVPRIPDSGDEGDALLRSGARRSGSAPPGSNASVRSPLAVLHMSSSEGQSVLAINAARWQGMIALHHHHVP